MATDSTGYRITPFVLWIAGGLGSIIAGIMIAMLDGISDKQDAMATSITTLTTSQRYDGEAISALKGDVKEVRGEVRALSDRVGKMEARK